MSERGPRARTSRRTASIGALALLLIATAAFRCPGPEPTAAAADGEGGGGAAATSTVAVTGTGGESGVGGDAGVGGTGGAEGTGGDAGGGGCGPTDDDPENCGACGRACSLEGVLNGACAGGVCTSSCVAGRVNITRPTAPDDDDGCERPGRRVFVTSAPVLPGFGGVSGADLACAGHAEVAGLGGVWKAWISDATGSPAEDFVRSDVPYLLVDGSPIAADFVELTDSDFSIDRPIDVDENGIGGLTVDVWTSTQPDGTAGDSNCDGWVSSAPTQPASIGRSDQSDNRWTYDPMPFGLCGDTATHLYCFEQ